MMTESPMKVTTDEKVGSITIFVKDKHTFTEVDTCDGEHCVIYPDEADLPDEITLLNSIPVIKSKTKVIGGPHADFPVLFKGTIPELIRAARQDGSNIRFYNSSGTWLKNEIIYFDINTGYLISWVNIPLLSSDDDYALRVGVRQRVPMTYYREREFLAKYTDMCPRVKPYPAVWYPKHGLVANCYTVPRNAAHTSTSRNAGVGSIHRCVCRRSPQKMPGKIGFSHYFEPYTFFEYGTGYASTLTGVTAWIKLPSGAVESPHLAPVFSFGTRYAMCVNTTNITITVGGHTYGFTANLSAGVWHHIFMMRDNNLRVYVDGVMVLNDAWSFGYGGGYVTNFRVGNAQYYNQSVKVWKYANRPIFIDQVKVFSILHPPSTNRLRTEYVNQSDPGAFILI